ncbi:hypothetical protein CDAR_118521 [Caerostris darwini]|uniref:Uncharacterized protein n=1 Tax=Caerostris darwini TaxID=1538125 RepID=A0AAV4X0P5_9ARAC|nr:hypothetical protein CDAR_118521 [Caerostris darwini]
MNDVKEFICKTSLHKELRKPEICQVNYVCRCTKNSSFPGVQWPQDRKPSKSRHPFTPDGAPVVLERPLVQPFQRGYRDWEGAPMENTIKKRGKVRSSPLEYNARLLHNRFDGLKIVGI